MLTPGTMFQTDVVSVSHPGPHHLTVLILSTGAQVGDSEAQVTEHSAAVVSVAPPHLVLVQAPHVSVLPRVGGDHSHLVTIIIKIAFQCA